jgi:integrase
MAPFKKGRIWWYRFNFAGQLIRESSKSTSKTIARRAEQQRRRGLELGFHNLKNVCLQRVRRLKDVIDEYLVGYRLRFRSPTFAEYALGHVSRWLGTKLIVDIDEAVVLGYQENRLRETAAPRSINEEVRFLLKMLGDLGVAIRARLKERCCLKLPVRGRIGKAFDSKETESLAKHAKKSKSPHMYPAFMLARNAGLRDAEIRTLSWGQINLKSKSLQVGHAKSNAGAGRIIPMNSDLHDALIAHREWYMHRFGATNDTWYLFPFGRPKPSDPTRHVTSLKTAWNNVRKEAKVTGRWHDNRHSLITELAEAGAGEETIIEIAGHVDRQMIRHYSHIRMQAKRIALDSILRMRKDH